MLKKIRGLFLGLVVLAGSACVTPTHASSAPSVVLAYVQASGEAGAKDELVVIHNNSSVEIDVTNWCLVNKSAVEFACFASEPDASSTPTHYFLPPYSSATIASNEHVTQSNAAQDFFSLIYTVTNQSSGSIVGSNDTLSIVDDSGEVIDTKSWASALPGEKAYQRLRVLSDPDIYATANETSDWTIVDRTVAPADSVELRQGYPEDDTTNTPELLITEILANVSGVDAGKEFIELYNPSASEEVSLNGFKIRVGFEVEKWYGLPLEAVIMPGEYRIFSDADFGFSLPNTAGKLQLFYGETAVGESIEYASPKDDQAWALINDTWQYATPTPGIPNKVLGAAQESKSAENFTKETAQKPCASNQYRNPATGRCKLAVASTPKSTPCKVGQRRNPETGRCRSVVANAITPTPCKAGQERNSETNRCRNIIKISDASYGVKGVQTQGNQPSWYYLAGIGLVIVGVAAYGVWEWRQELLGMWNRLRSLFAKRSS